MTFVGAVAVAEPTAFKEDFSTISDDWHVAHYDFSHPAFDTDWRRAQVQTDGGLLLKLSPQAGDGNRFIGGSIRRNKATQYGRYEVVMRAARGEGLVTGFFTYSGPHYGTRHDEIDIEFLGKDTTKMHVAWFVDGELTNKFIDLGFDAAERERAFAFEWQPDQLRWYSEGKLIFEHHARDGKIPEVPGRLFVNLWAAHPSISEWAGTTPAKISAQARVQEVQFRPFDTVNDPPRPGF
ncbi:family 16 glycosylhydrolase [Marinovum sp. 2_MG-2023]|uniref:family 16 glycosylhydrolase n=1 Tax=unclassified Marinovum TaxID=2647166 RepID=UPI0026E2CCE7|nr:MULTISPECIES: family 16 glycosylhydrolase [unclassified Marinovum]MDO6731975.1 family 16 glycosylhydrolase [Marinovum sp. 2_MG-2023]MDO6781227.1 family 16 glycosylhydrolase [Marinovum sp. 1_MG-2023]